MPTNPIVVILVVGFILCGWIVALAFCQAADDGEDEE